MISKKLARQSRHKWALRLVSNGLKHGEAMTTASSTKGVPLVFFFGENHALLGKGVEDQQALRNRVPWSTKTPIILPIPQVVCCIGWPPRTWVLFQRSPWIPLCEKIHNYHGGILAGKNSGEVSLKNHQHLLSKFVSTSLNPGLWMRNPWHDGQFDEHYFWLRRIKCQLAYSFLRQPWVTSQSVSLFLSKLKQNMKAKGGWFP